MSFILGVWFTCTDWAIFWAACSPKGCVRGSSDLPCIFIDMLEFFWVLYLDKFWMVSFLKVILFFRNSIYFSRLCMIVLFTKVLCWVLLCEFFLNFVLYKATYFGFMCCSRVDFFYTYLSLMYALSTRFQVCENSRLFYLRIQYLVLLCHLRIQYLVLLCHLRIQYLVLLWDKRIDLIFDSGRVS